jgi:hypothetical protein
MTAGGKLDPHVVRSFAETIGKDGFQIEASEGLAVVP